MATLAELAKGYQEAAALLAVGVEDVKAELDAEPDESRRRELEVKLKSLEQALREVRDLRRLCLTYYTRRQPERYSCVPFFGP